MAGTSDLSPAVLRDWMRDHLPSYMVPASIEICQELPLTASGKIDRQSLGTHDSRVTSSVPRIVVTGRPEFGNFEEGTL